MPVMPRAVVLLGAQRFDPTLGEAVEELGVTGKIATVTCGWQERETDDADLVEHLQGKCVNLRLHWRAEEVFKADPALHKAHRERQTLLRHRQDFYRIRLEHALDSEHVIRQRAAPDEVVEEELVASMEAIREIDAKHLARCARDRAEWEERMRPHERPAVAKHRQEISDLVRGCEALAIAGGHVASLLNRLSLFGIDQLAHDRVVFAWCAGAMALSERVVLFHDSPPQGPGAAEVLDSGLGLAEGVVVLPQPELRLKLDDVERVGVYARRFAPAVCVAMPARSRVTWIDGAPRSPDGVFELRDNGTSGPVSIHAAEHVPGQGIPGARGDGGEVPS